MTKINSSMKICSSFKNVWRAGYCDLHNIFYTREPVYYNCGVYGWNCDLYIDFSTDSIFTTGYRNMRGRSIPADLLKKYDGRARDILKNMFSVPYDDIKKQLEINCSNFLSELATV